MSERMATSRATRWARRFAPAALRALLAFVIVAAVARSGAHYFYCEALGLADVDPCLQGSTSSVKPCPMKALEESRVDCCDVITLPSVPSGASSENPRVQPASIVAVVSAALHVQHALDVAPGERLVALERWRKPPRSARSAGRARARLMVFLT